MKLRDWCLALVFCLPLAAQAHDGCVTPEEVAAQAAASGIPQTVVPLFSKPADLRAWLEIADQEHGLSPEYAWESVTAIVAVVDEGSGAVLVVPVNKGNCALAHAHKGPKTAVLSAWYGNFFDFKRMVEAVQMRARKSSI